MFSNYHAYKGRNVYMYMTLHFNTPLLWMIELAQLPVHVAYATSSLCKVIVVDV